MVTFKSILLSSFTFKSILLFILPSATIFISVYLPILQHPLTRIMCRSARLCNVSRVFQIWHFHFFYISIRNMDKHENSKSGYIKYYAAPIPKSCLRACIILLHLVRFDIRTNQLQGEFSYTFILKTRLAKNQGRYTLQTFSADLQTADRRLAD